MDNWSVYQRYRKDACERCGGLPEHVHHKDRDRGNGDASNLETLCESCHVAEHRSSWHEDRGLPVDPKRVVFQVRCKSEDLLLWKSAVPPGVPFSSWVRGALNAASSVGQPLPPMVLDPSVEPGTVELRNGNLVVGRIVNVGEPRPFRPDFRGGKP